MHQAGVCQPPINLKEDEEGEKEDDEEEEEKQETFPVYSFSCARGDGS